jgi:hypothetical protein
VNPMNHDMRQNWNRLDGINLVLLAVIALFIRIIYLYSYFENTPYAGQPLNDALSYWEMSFRIYREGWLLSGDGPFYQAPLYPYLLAGLHYLGYHGVVEVLWWQMGIGILNVLLTYMLARHYLNSRPAFAAALLFSFCHYTLFFEGKILATAAGILLFLLFSNLFVRWLIFTRYGWLMGSALVLSLAVLCRPNLIFMLPLLGVLLIYKQYSDLGLPIRDIGRRWYGLIQPALIFTMLFFLGVVPVTLRNTVVGGDAVFISANSGVTLYMGTNEQAQGGLGVVEGLSNNIADQHTGSIALASRLAGRNFSPSEASSFWVRKTFDWVIHHPWKFVVLELKKMLWALHAAPPAVNYSAHFESEFVSLHKVLRWFTLCSVAGGWAGMILLFRRRRLADWFLGSVLGGYVLLILVYYASDRFLAAILPITSILSLMFVQWMRQVFRVKGFRSTPFIRGWMVFLIALVVAANPWLGWNIRLEKGMGWYNLGVLQEQKQQVEQAQRSYENGLEVYPNFPPLLLNLGVLYARQNRLEESTRLFERGLQLDPDHPVLLRNLEINRQRMSG